MSALSLHIPLQDEVLFSSLPAECIASIHQRHSAVRALLAVKGVAGRAGEVASKWASVLGLSVSRVRMMATEFQRLGWQALWDRSKWPHELAREMLPKEFVASWHSRCLHRDGGKSLAQIWEKLIRDWREARQLHRDAVFPGYRETPSADLSTKERVPTGWTSSNLVKQAPSKAALKLAWEGAGAYRGVGPQVLTDRKTIAVGARLQIDDYHWNKHVIFQKSGGVAEIVRVHQLGIYDVRSACLPSVFFHPTVTRDDGTKDGIKQDHTLLLLSAYLFTHGYIPGVTTLALERGTAGLHERHREAFAHFAPGLFFDDAGSRERHQVHGWSGKDRTNPNKKAGLESLHHLLTNIEGGGIGDTGANYTEQAEHVHGLVKETRWLLSKVATHEQLALLQLGLLDFSQFGPWARGVIAVANGRRNHSLQGFPAITHFRPSPESEDWLTPQEILALPEASRLALSAGVASAPSLYTAKIKQSPLDVWREGRAGLTRLSAMQACHLAASVMGKGTMASVIRPRQMQRAYFQLSESRLAYLSEPIIFESRILKVDGTWEELAADRPVEIVFNPLDDSTPRKCFVRDERGGFMGVAVEAERINPNDKEALLDALCHRSERTAERTKDVRDAFAADREAVTATKAHNRRVLAGEPVTAEQKRAARAARVNERNAREAIADFTTNHAAHTTTTTDEKTDLNRFE